MNILQVLLKMEEKERIEKFLTLSNKKELAEVLDIPYKTFLYYLYGLDDSQKYISFEIPKRNGKVRQIDAPIQGLKIIQAKLAGLLDRFYPVKPWVHGYVRGRSIVSNAIPHSRQCILINLDLKDFFPSIHFGRVRGMFKAWPFHFTDEIATTLAQLCCHNGSLPQGSPSSPIISNYICYKLDNQLAGIACRNRVYYSRYADDLTFSTNLRELPKEIGAITHDTFLLSEQVSAAVQANGFMVNERKTRFARKHNRQEVTGLIVNSGINVNRKFVREIRAMLHAWEKFGLADAAREHFTTYRKMPATGNMELRFIHMLAGKINYIGHIKGKGDPVYNKLAGRLSALRPEISFPGLTSVLTPKAPTVFCEGKTDSLHLQAALRWFKRNKEFEKLRINIFQHGKDYNINNTELMKACETMKWAKTNDTVVICLFDRDDTSINMKASALPQPYKAWGNHVFSLLLPVPPHRDFNEICIEHYYPDKDLMTVDGKGRRIFLSTEFSPENGHHKSEKLICSDKNRLKANYPRIIDCEVVNMETGEKVALSKNDFANNIYRKKGPFREVSFEHFRPLFELFAEIIRQAGKTGSE